MKKKKKKKKKKKNHPEKVWVRVNFLTRRIFWRFFACVCESVGDPE